MPLTPTEVMRDMDARPWNYDSAFEKYPLKTTCLHCKKSIQKNESHQRSHDRDRGQQYRWHRDCYPDACNEARPALNLGPILDTDEI